MTTDTESTNIRQLEFGDLGKSWLQHGLGRRCDSFGRFRVGGLDLPENLWRSRTTRQRRLIRLASFAGAVFKLRVSAKSPQSEAIGRDRLDAGTQ